MFPIQEATGEARLELRTKRLQAPRDLLYHDLGDKQFPIYISKNLLLKHIRPQSAETWASRPLCHKQLNGRLVLRWVTTWESLLLYVLDLFPLHFRFASPAT
jgi:hypothetical protein